MSFLSRTPAVVGFNLVLVDDRPGRLPNGDEISDYNHSLKTFIESINSITDDGEVASSKRRRTDETVTTLYFYKSDDQVVEGTDSFMSPMSESQESFSSLEQDKRFLYFSARKNVNPVEMENFTALRGVLNEHPIVYSKTMKQGDVNYIVMEPIDKNLYAYLTEKKHVPGYASIVFDTFYSILSDVETIRDATGKIMYDLALDDFGICIHDVGRENILKIFPASFLNFGTNESMPEHSLFVNNHMDLKYTGRHPEITVGVVLYNIGCQMLISLMDERLFFDEDNNPTDLNFFSERAAFDPALYLKWIVFLSWVFKGAINDKHANFRDIKKCLSAVEYFINFRSVSSGKDIFENLTSQNWRNFNMGQTTADLTIIEDTLSEDTINGVFDDLKTDDRNEYFTKGWFEKNRPTVDELKQERKRILPSFLRSREDLLNYKSSNPDDYKNFKFNNTTPLGYIDGEHLCHVLKFMKKTLFGKNERMR